MVPLEVFLNLDAEQNRAKASRRKEKKQRMRRQESQDWVCIQSQPPTVVCIVALVDIMDGFSNDVLGFTSLCCTGNASANIMPLIHFPIMLILYWNYNWGVSRTYFIFLSFMMNVCRFFSKRSTSTNTSSTVVQLFMKICANQMQRGCMWGCIRDL